MSAPRALCRLDDLGQPGSKGFVLPDGREVLVVRHVGGVHAYLNRCPHTGVPLEWVPDQFLDLDKTHIQCATHDARFRFEDGFCVAGPCAGESLSAISVEVRDDAIFLAG